jgi:heme/copper-type cytochrome/quinol oxidase subunit 2
MSDPRDPRTHAVQAEVLYLINLLLAPGLAFLLLLWLAYRHRASTNPLTRCHLRQTVTASIGAGLLLTVVPAIIVLAAGLDHPMTWVLLVLYVLCCHATLVLLGVLGLSRAIASKTFVYPLLGRRTW